MDKGNVEKLKPVRCGCGGEAKAWDFMNGRWYVKCQKCAIGQMFAYRSETEAIEAWNRAMGCNLLQLTDEPKHEETCYKLATDESIKQLTSKLERTAKVEKGAYDLMRCECGMPVSSNFDYCPKCRARLEWK